MTPRTFYRWATGARRRFHDQEDNELFHLTMMLKGQGSLETDAPPLRLPRPDEEP